MASRSLTSLITLAIALGFVAALGSRGEDAAATVRSTPGGARLVRRSLVMAEVAMAPTVLPAPGAVATAAATCAATGASATRRSAT